MSPYLDHYNPPMPVLEIHLAYPEGSPSLGPLAAIIDTGADSMLVPQDLPDRIGAPFSDEARLRSHWGEWRQVALFIVDLGIEDLRLPNVEVVGDDEGDEIILGRNVLNRLRLLLDGPAGTVDVLDR
jgi:predicted aspartyl protease